jgi:hypothetical protein
MARERGTPKEHGLSVERGLPLDQQQGTSKFGNSDQAVRRESSHLSS